MFRGQFDFAAFEYKIYIEGIEVPLDSFTLTQSENQPSHLTASLFVSEYASDFLTVLDNKPIVILTVKATGEHYNEDWHVLFIGYVTQYGLSITPGSIMLYIEAKDFLNLMRETTMYSINPAIHWIQISEIFTGQLVDYAERLTKIIGKFLTSDYAIAVEGLVNFTGLYTKLSVEEYNKAKRQYGKYATAPSEPQRGEASQYGNWAACPEVENNQTGTQYIDPEIWYYGDIADISMINYRKERGIDIKLLSYFGNTNVDIIKQLNKQWQTLSFYLNRLVWLVNEFFKWIASETFTNFSEDVKEEIQKACNQYKQRLKISNEENLELFVKPFITSGYRTQTYNEQIGGAKGSMHICAGAADIKMKIYKRYRQTDKTITEEIGWLHIYELMCFVDRIFYNGGRGLYQSSLSEHYMHVDIGPKRDWGTMPGSKEKTTYASMAIKAQTQYENKYPGCSNDFQVLFTAFILLFEKSILDQADLAMRAEEEKFFPLLKPAEYKLAELKAELELEKLTAISPSEHGAGFECALAFSRVRSRCEENKIFDDLPYIDLQPTVYEHDEYAPLPWLGMYRDFMITHMICPKDAARWSANYTIIKNLLTGQSTKLSDTRYTLWDIFQFFLSATMHQIIPIPCGCKTDSGYKLWAIVPKLETADIEGKCIPIPECNKFYATTSWGTLNYSINVRNIPTAIAGIIDVGDADIQGQESTLSKIATLFPVELAIKVEGKQRDLNFRTTFTNEESWRGPNRVLKNYDLYRLGLMSAEIAKSSEQQNFVTIMKNDVEEEQLCLLLHDLALRDYYVSTLNQGSLSLQIGYWPYVIIGYPAQFITDVFSIYGIVSGITIVGTRNHISTTVHLRNVFNTLDKPYRTLYNNLGRNKASNDSIFDPWLMDVDLSNIRMLLLTIHAASNEKEKLTLHRTRPLFYLDGCNGLPVREQMIRLVQKHAYNLRGIGMGVSWSMFEGPETNLYKEEPHWMIIKDIEKEKFGKYEELTHE